MKRLFRHLFPPSVRRWFPASSLARIAAAIADDERAHTGEVMFAVEADLPILAVLRGASARERALDAFARLRTWDTEANNGVLIYLLLADHAIEIVADRGLRDLVTDAQWRGVCDLMEAQLGARAPEHAVVQGVAEVSALLAWHFPRPEGTPDADELSNQPQLLD